ncbi:hypothetical protein AAC387_Pa02g1838 [Persea americana]
MCEYCEVVLATDSGVLLFVVQAKASSSTGRAENEALPLQLLHLVWYCSRSILSRQITSSPPLIREDFTMTARLHLVCTR